ncbi:MAG: hypothetical protein IPO66_19195 [Rhodanobacteraceae bacterium]|nr:hypothetical protein [Rhodanobacteraceae bacterium]
MPTGPLLVLFDGGCAFCHASVRLAAMEDQRQLLLCAAWAAAPLQRRWRRVGRTGRATSIVVVDGQRLW